MLLEETACCRVDELLAFISVTLKVQSLLVKSTGSQRACEGSLLYEDESIVGRSSGDNSPGGARFEIDASGGVFRTQGSIHEGVF